MPKKSPSGELLESIRAGAPEILAKASENYASREEFEELRRIVSELRVLIAGLQSGTVEAAREAADGALELAERMEHLGRPREAVGSRLATKTIVEMARRGELSGRLLENVVQRSRLITAGWQGEKPTRGAMRDRVVASDALEKGLLQRLAKGRRHRRDLFGRKMGA